MSGWNLYVPAILDIPTVKQYTSWKSNTSSSVLDWDSNNTFIVFISSLGKVSHYSCLDNKENYKSSWISHNVDLILD